MGRVYLKIFLKNYKPCVTAKQLKIILSYRDTELFAETAGQNHKSRSWSMRRGQNFDLQLHAEPKDLDVARTCTPEHFQKQRVCRPGRSCDDTPHHKRPSSKILQWKPTPPTLPHTCSRRLFKTNSETWIGEFRYWRISWPFSWVAPFAIKWPIFLHCNSWSLVFGSAGTRCDEPSVL